MTFRIFTSPLKAVDGKVGVCVGIGEEVSLGINLNGYFNEIIDI